MRTRTSNRTKTFKEPDISSGDEAQQTRRKRRKSPSEKDGNFDAGAAAELNEGQNDDQSSEVDEIGLETNEETNGDSDVVMSDAGERDSSRQRTKRAKPAKTKPERSDENGYLDVEPVPIDGHQYKGYSGPFDRHARGQPLLNLWFGPQRDRRKLAQRLLERWMKWTVLPPKCKVGPSAPRSKGLWASKFIEREKAFAEGWYAKLAGGLSSLNSLVPLPPEDTPLYQFPNLEMPVLVGSATDPQEVKFRPGDCHVLSKAGLPFDRDDSEDKISSGWMLDTGGIVIGMDWAYQSPQQPAQLLALAVVPHADQENYNYEEESVKPGFQKYGIVQLWECTGEETESDYIRPSTKAARLAKTLCLDHGRAQRVKWNPTCSLLAILCSDGKVYIIAPGTDGDGAFEKVEYPLAILSLVDEEAVKAVCMTWVMYNRIAVGYSDGSIGLWSISPIQLLLRHPVHHNPVMDIASGYPTVPFVVASAPIGGITKVIDLQAPSYETTEVQNSAVHAQPNLMAYSDHNLGFFSLYPTASPISTTIGFMHHTQFPVVRRVFTGDSFLGCLSVGQTHPFLIIGTQDGSLWGANSQVELFSSKRQPSNRLRIFQHEHRPKEEFPLDSPASYRGVSRIVHGFPIDKNRNAKAEARATTKKSARGKKDKQAAEDDDEDAPGSDPSRAIVYEPLSRITVAAWNPNDGYGCWAAAAMGSGLVKIMDLGLEQH